MLLSSRDRKTVSVHFSLEVFFNFSVLVKLKPKVRQTRL